MGGVRREWDREKRGLAFRHTRRQAPPTTTLPLCFSHPSIHPSKHAISEWTAQYIGSNEQCSLTRGNQFTLSNSAHHVARPARAHWVQARQGARARAQQQGQDIAAFANTAAAAASSQSTVQQQCYASSEPQQSEAVQQQRRGESGIAAASDSAEAASASASAATRATAHEQRQVRLRPQRV